MKRAFRVIISVFAMCAAAVLLTVVLCACSDGAAEESAPALSPSDLVISEVLTSNTKSAKAYDGRYYDWVEFYNPTEQDVSLDDYFLSDDLEKLQKTSLKGQIIKAGGYLIVYCSGLNITDERGYLHTSFKLSGTNGETVYLSDSKSIASVAVPASQPDVSYGLGEDGVTYGWLDQPTPGKPNTGRPQTVTFPVRINEYMSSNTFTIYDCEGDCGDWIELYNADSSSCDISGYGLTDSDSAPLKYQFPEGTVIKAKGYLLVYCDKKNKKDKKGLLHTNFSIGAEDEHLSLYAPDEQLLSRAPVHELPENISCGVSGEGEYLFFARPTPGAENKTTAFRQLTPGMEPVLGAALMISETLSASGKIGDGSRYDYIELYNRSGKEISLKGYTLSNHPGSPACTLPACTLGPDGYLLLVCDGNSRVEEKKIHVPIKINAGGETFYLSDPAGMICDVFSTGKGRVGVSSGRLGTDASKRYFFTTPTPGKPNEGTHYSGYAPVPEFSLDGGLVESGAAVSLSVEGDYRIVYTTDGSEPSVSSPIYKKPIVIKQNTVVRAAATGKDALISECVTQTYFTNNPHSIPIFCVSGAPADLTGRNGIFRNADNNSEYKIYAEYFNSKGGKETGFPCGIKLFGHSSRNMPQKGVKLMLREVYGVNEITYPFFSCNDRVVATMSSMLLRPSGEDQLYSRMRDEVVPAIIRGCMDLDYEEYQPCALYVNGKYWGLYYIREPLNDDYLKRYYGYQKGDYDLIKGQSINQEGTKDAYRELTAFCRENDLTVKENYEKVCKVVDLDSLINFWIVETYFGNTDTVNIRCYKHRDGKWRWMIYDMDWSMQVKEEFRNYNFIDYHVLNKSGHGIGHFDNSIIRKLLENDEFRTRFLTAYCYHLNHTFASDRTVRILDDLANAIDGEIKLNQKVLWRRPTYEEWSKKTVPYLRTYLQVRPDEMKRDIMKSFQLSESDWEKYVGLSKNYHPEKDAIK